MIEEQVYDDSESCQIGRPEYRQDVQVTFILNGTAERGYCVNQRRD